MVLVSVLPDNINPASTSPPSMSPVTLPVKVCRTVKSISLVLTAKTVPEPELPPSSAVPYRVLLDKINPAYEVPPSLWVNAVRTS